MFITKNVTVLIFSYPSGSRKEKIGRCNSVIEKQYNLDHGLLPLLLRSYIVNCNRVVVYNVDLFTDFFLLTVTLVTLSLRNSV